VTYSSYWQITLRASAASARLYALVMFCCRYLKLGRITRPSKLQVARQVSPSVCGSHEQTNSSIVQCPRAQKEDLLEWLCPKRARKCALLRRLADQADRRSQHAFVRRLRWHEHREKQRPAQQASGPSPEPRRYMQIRKVFSYHLQNITLRASAASPLHALVRCFLALRPTRVRRSGYHPKGTQYMRVSYLTNRTLE